MARKSGGARKTAGSLNTEERAAMTTDARQRRPKGSGTLRHLGGDRYKFALEIDGAQMSRNFRARNATEANKAAATVQAELVARHNERKRSGGAEREERRGWTVKQYSAYYFERWAPYHLADTTRARYLSIHTHQIIPNIGHLRMAEVTPSDLTAMYQKLGAKGARLRGGEGGLSGLTISTAHNIVRALFSFACDVEGDFTTNPATSKAARPKVDRNGRKPRALDVAEVERFVARVGDEAPHIAVPVMLSAYLGTRRGETVGLRWSDVDYEARTITVRRSVSYTQASGLNVKDTKTHKERTIPLDTFTLSRLKSIQQQQRTERLRFGRGWQGAESPAEDYMATTPEGSVMRPDAFGAFFRTFCEQREIGGMTLHGLRHTWVSQMIALGFDAVTISAMSGHSPEVLLTTYAHAFDARKREAMDALGQAREAARAAM